MNSNNTNNNSSSSSSNRIPKTKSIFSGFWTDSEIIEQKENNNNNNNNNNTNNNNNNNNKTSIDYEGFYLTIGDTVYEIGIGDVVAMRNSFEPEYPPPVIPMQSNDKDKDKKEQEKEKVSSERVAGAGAATMSARNSNSARARNSTSEYTMDAVSDKPSDYYNYRGAVQTVGNANDKALESPVEEETSTPRQQLPQRAKKGDGLMLARVERIWKETFTNTGITKTSDGTTTNNNNKNKVLFKARWFLKKEDVDSLPLGELTGPVSSRVFAETITQHDLVLSNQSDDNHVTTICDLLQVLYRNPELDAKMPPRVLPSTYLCRYSLRIDGDSRVVVLPYTGDNDDWKEMTVSALDSKKRRIATKKPAGSSPSQFRDKNLFMSPRQKTNRAEERGEMTASAQKRRRVGDFANHNNNNNNIDDDGEDGTDQVLPQMNIQVGPAHQVPVPRFDPSQKPNPETIVSRNPVCMWIPHRIGQEGTAEYMEKVAEILTPYLREHHLTQEEPYAPFPTQRMEELSCSLGKQRLPTLSSVSSAVSLTKTKSNNSHKKVNVLREYNVDALLRNLHVSNYNVPLAVASVEASPTDFLVAWSPYDRARFNAGFRRYSGSLRAIYKGMGNKKLTDVIDYHYRFKIPDQFRKVQERKREQAVRMLECIETRRNLNAPIVIRPGITVGSTTSSGSSLRNGGGTGTAKSGEKTTERGDWTKTGSSSLAVSVEERRVKAKELLLDVEAKLGKNKMMKVFEVFKCADETTLVECKTKLLEICKGHKDFQIRFLEFLPQELRL